jgi:hypothetical protein
MFYFYMNESQTTVSAAEYSIINANPVVRTVRYGYYQGHLETRCEDSVHVMIEKYMGQRVVYRQC